jgi:hypothetical protein
MFRNVHSYEFWYPTSHCVGRDSGNVNRFFRSTAGFKLSANFRQGEDFSGVLGASMFHHNGTQLGMPAVKNGRTTAAAF